MNEIDQCLNVIEGLRRGTCWCEKGIDNPNYRSHTGTCQGAVELLTRYGRYVPTEAKQ
jgi:hypothetical protein